MPAGIENLFKVPHRIDAALLKHFARKHVAGGGQRIAKGESFATQIVKGFNRAIGPRDDRGVVEGNPFALGFENHFDIRFVFRKHVGCGRQKCDVEFIDAQGFNHAGVIRGDERLNLHAQFFAQDFNDGLSILHYLLSILGGNKTHTEGLGLASGITARLNGRSNKKHEANFS